MTLEAATKKTGHCDRSFSCGATENRTRDTRIFSPLLYQLSYGTIFWECKDNKFILICKIFNNICIPFQKPSEPVHRPEHAGDRGLREEAFVLAVGILRHEEIS